MRRPLVEVFWFDIVKSFIKHTQSLWRMLLVLRAKCGKGNRPLEIPGDSAIRRFQVADCFVIFFNHPIWPMNEFAERQQVLG